MEFHYSLKKKGNLEVNKNTLKTETKINHLDEIAE
jgi:hypothetical protein